MTIPRARELVVRLQSLFDTNGSEIDTDACIKELDTILEKLYTDLSSFLKPQGKNEADHAVVKLLELCCCLQWRARRIGGMGDFCPDCIKHGDSAGMATGEIKIIRPPKSIWGSRKKRV